MGNTYKDYDNEYYLMFEALINKQLEVIQINEELDNKGYPSAICMGRILFNKDSANALKWYCEKRNLAVHEDTCIHDGEPWSELRVKISTLDVVCCFSG